jgi:hypothetical protein
MHYRHRYNSILIIIDRFFKIIYYILVYKSIKALELAKVFIRKVVRLYSPPKSIILD